MNFPHLDEMFTGVKSVMTISSLIFGIWQFVSVFPHSDGKEVSSRH